MLPINLKLPDSFFEEEVRCDYKIDKKTKKLWAVELDLLNQFIKVCEENKLRYFVCAGTLLGAVRHKGFIPWDDDIDVMMPRKDYKKLCKIADRFESPYFFQTQYTDPGSLRGHAQLRNSKTTAILNSEMNTGFKFNQGVFLDIFPLDNLPDDPDQRRAFIKKVTSMHRYVLMFRNVPARKALEKNPIKKIVKYIASPVLITLNRLFNIDHKLYIKYEKLMQKYNHTKTQDVAFANFLSQGDRFVWNKSILFAGTESCNFEMLKVKIPKRYDEVLQQSYGDWHQLVKGGSVHGGMLVDVEKPYTRYIK